ncbi:MAG: LysM peptidoglycan-binding domain-containing protein [Flavobacteriaceae bacterium]|nr:LysM peptidoglycan-binding domain-containing protein [Flavobacteriaceae bacterium]
MKIIKLFILLFVLGTQLLLSQQKKYTTYTVKKGETIENISASLGVSSEVLKKLNPDIAKGVQPGLVLVIPNKSYSKSQDITNFDTSMAEGKDIIVDGFIYHEVLPKETMYALSTKYKIPSSTIKNNNPFLFETGLQVGQTIKIPLVPTENKVNTDQTKPYVVKAKDTKFSIAKNNQITIGELEAINPGIKEELKINDLIYIPKGKAAVSDNGNYEVHTVLKGETLYSLSKTFGISQEELLLANPELKEGVREGMLVKIPKNEVSTAYVPVNKNSFRDRVPSNTKLRAAMLLPFQSKAAELNFENNKLLNATTDFYLETLIALDSLQKQGMDIEMVVYDTEKSPEICKGIITRNDFNKFDAVIGPMYYNEMEVVASLLENSKPLVISPLSEKDHSAIPNNHLVQATATLNRLDSELLHFLSTHHNNENLVIVSDDASVNQLNAVMNELKKKVPEQQIKTIKPGKGFVSASLLRTSLSAEQENWVILAGKSEILISDLIHNLGVLPDKYKITLFAFDKGKNSIEIDNHSLERIRFHFPSLAFENYDDPKAKQFMNTYKLKFGGVPSSYAFKGFDVTYDILMRLADSEEISTQGTSERLWNKFNYVQNSSGNVTNQAVYMLHYEGLELKSAN